jgi:hypothetical protein
MVLWTDLLFATAFVVYITCVGVCVVSMLATIKGSVANRLKNQVYWSNKRQKKLMKVCVG